MRPKDLEKREAIKQATFALVAEHGVPALKMADLAKRAGVSASSLYTYFEDKDHLIQTLFREVMKTMVGLAIQEFQSDRPYKINLKEFWIAYLRYRIQHHNEILFCERVKASPYFQKTVTETKMMELAVPMQLIRLGQEQLLLKEMDERILFAALDGMAERMTTLFTSGEMSPTEENIAYCFTLLWDCIKA